MRCPACGADNPDIAERCTLCDTRLEPEAAADASGDVYLAGYRVASLGDRFLAHVLDALLLAPVFALIGYWAAVRWNEPALYVGGLAGWIAAGLSLLAAFVYFWILEGAFGATLGKLLAGVQVRRQNGDNSNFGASFWRNLARLVDGLALYLVAFLVMLMSPRRRRIGDYLGGTVVVSRYVSLPGRLVAVLVWMAAIAGTLWGLNNLTAGRLLENVSTRLSTPLWP